MNHEKYESHEMENEIFRDFRDFRGLKFFILSTSPRDTSFLLELEESATTELFSVVTGKIDIGGSL